MKITHSDKRCADRKSIPRTICVPMTWGSRTRLYTARENDGQRREKHRGTMNAPWRDDAHSISSLLSRSRCLFRPPSARDQTRDERAEMDTDMYIRAYTRGRNVHSPGWLPHEETNARECDGKPSSESPLPLSVQSGSYSARSFSLSLSLALSLVPAFSVGSLTCTLTGRFAIVRIRSAPLASQRIPARSVPRVVSFFSTSLSF